VSVELPAMRTTEAIDEYDLVALRDNIEHLGSRVGDRVVWSVRARLRPVRVIVRTACPS
jgi:hypothetical protein